MLNKNLPSPSGIISIHFKRSCSLHLSQKCIQKSHLYGKVYFGYHWFRLWLVICSKPKKCLNQCWFIADLTPRNKCQWNMNQNKENFHSRKCIESKYGKFSFKKMYLKMLSVKWCHFVLASLQCVHDHNVSHFVQASNKSTNMLHITWTLTVCWRISWPQVAMDKCGDYCDAFKKLW